MRIIGTAAVAVLLAFSPAGAGAQDTTQDAARGEVKAADCVACHGAMGISNNPLFPNLAGQNGAYLQLQLEKFREGERYHALMTPVAESLSQQDINDLAAYYSSITPMADAR